MTDAGMSAAIKSAIEGKRGPPTTDQELQDFCDALGMAIVEYIKSNAEVSTTGVDPQGGTVSSTGTVS